VCILDLVVIIVTNAEFICNSEMKSHDFKSKQQIIPSKDNKVRL